MNRISQIKEHFQMTSKRTITISTHVLDTCNGVAAKGKQEISMKKVSMAPIHLDPSKGSGGSFFIKVTDVHKYIW